MIFEVLGHVSVGHICQVVEGLRTPSINPVQLEKEAGLAVVVPVVLLSDAFDVTSLEIKCDKFTLPVWVSTGGGGEATVELAPPKKLCFGGIFGVSVAVFLSTIWVFGLSKSPLEKFPQMTMTTIQK